ncbi:uncharacterized protein LOC131063797 [Cryptomeria japonica]|uniref:uncharacterized protein LOC131063797 n=1 Tax=Cryptomeria japonica TaxID=3369 RepID=UPI0027DA789A|nr:uncharacterized protein LOC131063797 [Cryptomeria japonica]
MSQYLAEDLLHSYCFISSGLWIPLADVREEILRDRQTTAASTHTSRQSQHSHRSTHALGIDPPTDHFVAAEEEIRADQVYITDEDLDSFEQLRGLSHTGYMDMLLQSDTSFTMSSHLVSSLHSTVIRTARERYADASDVVDMITGHDQTIQPTPDTHLAHVTSSLSSERVRRRDSFDAVSGQGSIGHPDSN